MKLFLGCLLMLIKNIYLKRFNKKNNHFRSLDIYKGLNDL